MLTGTVPRVAMDKYEVTATSIRPSTSRGAFAGSVLISGRVAAFYERVLPEHARGTLLDLGCGRSPFRPFYGPLVSTAWSVDWPSSVHAVRLDVNADVSTGVPFRTDSTDTIVASDVMEHLAEPGRFLDECARVLRRDGTLLGNVPFAYWLHEEPHDYFRYTEYGLRHLLGKAGFSHIEVAALGGGADVLVDVVGKAVTNAPVIGATTARVLQRGRLRSSRLPSEPSGSPRSWNKYPLAYGFIARRSAGDPGSSSGVPELP